MTARIVVIYYSATGNVRALAEAICEGARVSGAEVRLRRVAETAPEDAIIRNPNWQKHIEFENSERGAEVAALDDLAWADGIALGTPTRFGGPAAQLKNYLDQTGGLWAKGDLSTKIVTGFTSASTSHGGLETTILSLLNVAYHWGALVLPLGYGDSIVRDSTGNPYGSSWVSIHRSQPDEESLGAARAQGARLAKFASALKRGFSAGDNP